MAVFSYKYNILGSVFRTSKEQGPQEYNYKTGGWEYSDDAADIFYGYDYAPSCSEEFALRLIENGGKLDDKQN